MPPKSSRSTSPEPPNDIVSETRLKVRLYLQSRDASDSLLLALPTEIRLMIWGYALTDENGLRVSKFEGTDRYLCTTKGGSPTKIFNQLANVCQMVRAETQGLEVRFNTLFFGSPSITTQKATLLFLDFYRTIVSSKRAWPNRVILKGFAPSDTDVNFRFDWITSPENIFILWRLLRFCHAYPKIEVDLYIPGFQTLGDTYREPVQLVECGLLLTLIARGIDKSHLLENKAMFEVHNCSNTDPIWKKCMELGSRTPNLRLFPKDEIFRTGLFKEKAMRWDGTRYDKGLVETWVEMVQGWYDHGI